MSDGSSDHTPPRLALQYFDGRQARAQTATVWCDAEQLHLRVDGRQLSYPRRSVLWPERQRHGRRQAQLPDGGVLEAPDAAAWDDWARASGLRDPQAARWAQSWRHACAAVLLLSALLWGGWHWGIPMLAEGASALVGARAEQQIGEQALASFDGLLLGPSRLPEARRAAIEADFARLVEAGRARGMTLPDYRLHFRAGLRDLGPNALALPGGQIVLTDALAELLADAPDALAGVLAHELGHVQQRHGLRLVMQSGLLGAVAGLVVGDFSTLLAGIPTVLGQQAYSRDFEREADRHAYRLLRAGGRSPRAMLLFFERIEAQRRAEAGGRDSGPLPIAISSHPADAERRRFFED